MKHLLRIKDLTKKDFDTIINGAMACKTKVPSSSTIKGKHAVSFFSKSSSRTKSSWEVACFNLGMESSYNDAASSQLGHKESIKDSARVFSQFYDIMG
jgi:ornithine carbamoyltransferase